VNVDLYERIWMWGVGVMLSLFFAATAYSAVAREIHPPSHVETIDPAQSMSDPRFAKQGLWTDRDGNLHLTVMAMMYTFLPQRVTVPAGVPITFHLTSRDVVHGYQVIGSNAQAMVVPGYVSQFTTIIPEPGEYLIACNEYCGIGHHQMSTTMIAVPAGEFTGPEAMDNPFTSHAGGH
jgi:cytochrome c oxidase subunit 2